jgi:hypothetical protein
VRGPTGPSPCRCSATAQAHADAVVSAGASADLIEHDERTGGGVVEDVGRFVHLDHEGRVAAGEFVRSPDAAEDAVDEAMRALVAGTQQPRCASKAISAT